MNNKKKKEPYRTIINDMIDKSKGRKKEILIELRKLNKEAYLIMHSNYYNAKLKYDLLQKQPCWEEGKKLLLEYFTYDNILVCHECGEVIDSRRCVVHHDSYDWANLFTPIYIKIIHPHCHEKIHGK